MALTWFSLTSVTVVHIHGSSMAVAQCLRRLRRTSFRFRSLMSQQWIAAANYQESDWESLVELWYHYNRLIAVLIRNMREASLSTRCTITPYETCKLAFLVRDYLDHMKHHLNKIADRALKTKAI
ncbi:MAG: hypothetical protein JNL58_08665 [Planctomyces sp.]|nr:hypothetical protein [Planctomyces sp.]